MTTGDLDVPRRGFDTAWGLLQASCEHPHRVRFSSWLEPDRGASTHLVINRATYVFDCTASRAEVHPELRHCRIYLDPTWHVPRRSSWSLSRPESQVATASEAVQSFVRVHLVPILVRWLTCDQAAALLVEGDTYWRTACKMDSEAVEQRLLKAVTRIRRLRDLVAQGQVISDDNERFLRTVDLDWS